MLIQILIASLSLLTLVGGLTHSSTQQSEHTAETAKDWSGPYTLDTCPISGGKLGSMGDPVVKTYDGREIRFCCAGCVGKFEADKAAAWKKVDAAIIKDQARYYPMTTCAVSGKALDNDANDFVYNNRLVRLCCKSCERKFKADPAKFIEKLDTAAADAQRADYPLETCVISGGQLGSMGEPTEMVMAGRLIRFCCSPCEAKALKNPAKCLAELDAGWQAKGRFTPEPEG